MSKMPAKARNALPASKFGLPDQRKYPMPDRGHAANAKARASQQQAKGGITSGQKARIDRTANRILGETAGHTKAGGRKAVSHFARIKGAR